MVRKRLGFYEVVAVSSSVLGTCLPTLNWEFPTESLIGPDFKATVFFVP